MHSSGLNHPIEIQRKVQIGTLPAGDPKFVWQKFRECFASVTSRRGREHWDQAARQRVAEVVYHFRTHWEDVEGIDETMRIIDENGSAYDIRSALPDADRHDDCIIECTLQNGRVGTAPLLGYIEDAIFDGIVGEAYEPFFIKASGGTAPYEFYIADGALPAGLDINAATGAVEGIPSAAGAFSVTFAVSDTEYATHTLPPLAITVSAA